MSLKKKDSQEAIVLVRDAEVTINVGDVFTLTRRHFAILVNATEMVDTPVVSEQTTLQSSVQTLPSSSDTSLLQPERIQVMKPDQVAVSTASKRLPFVATGKKVKAFWEKSGRWFEATVMQWDDSIQKAQVVFGESHFSYWVSYADITMINPTSKSSKHAFVEREASKRKNEAASSTISKNDKKMKPEDDEVAFNRNTRTRRPPIVYGDPVELASSDSSKEEKHIKTTYQTRMLNSICDILGIQRSELADKKTIILFHAICSKHIVPPWHLEKPERLDAIYDAIIQLSHEFPSALAYTNRIEPVSNEMLLKVFLF